MSQPKFIMVAGFSIILCLVLVSILVAGKAVTYTHNLLEDSVTINNQKIKHVTNMHMMARERVISLLRMLFVAEEGLQPEVDKIMKAGGSFAKSREEYLMLPHSADEKAFFDQQAAISTIVVPFQHEAMDLILFDEHEAAEKLIFEQVMPGQDRVTDLLSQLVDIQLRKSLDGLATSNESYNDLINELWGFFFGIIIFSLSILAYMLYLITKNETQQALSHQQLEAQVLDRTYELKASHDESLLAFQQAEMASNEAIKANAAKSEFLSSMSHELRTPLNSIIGFAYLLQHQKEPDLQVQKDYAKRIGKAGDHLLELINEVLDLARVESGQFDMVIQHVQLQNVLKECYTMIEPLAEKAQLSLSFETEVTHVVKADPVRLRQALLNLLSNAVKYNVAQGSVRVSYESEKGRFRINVKDTGGGLSEDQRSRLFIPFERLGAGSGSIQGTGIGLTITRKLMESMEGSVGIYEADGTGCCFWLELELVEADGLETQAKLVES